MTDRHQELKQQLMEIIATIERDHRKQVQPYYDQLAKIVAMEMPTHYFHVGDIDPEMLKRIKKEST